MIFLSMTIYPRGMNGLSCMVGLVKGDLDDTKLLNETLDSFQPDAVIHFAASIQVGESVLKTASLLPEQRRQYIESVGSHAEQ